MNNFIKFFIFLNIFLPITVYGSEFSVMTLNVDNLFDTLDDKNKDDKAYLPIEAKQSDRHIKSCNRIRVKSWKNECLYLDWDEKAKDAKLNNLVATSIYHRCSLTIDVFVHNCASKYTCSVRYDAYL